MPRAEARSGTGRTPGGMPLHSAPLRGSRRERSSGRIMAIDALVNEAAKRLEATLERDGDDWVCPETGERYRQDEETLTRLV